MKKSTYSIVSRLPFGKAILFAFGQDEMLMCSPFMETEDYQRMMAFAKAHPDEVITRKLGEQILKGSKK